MTYPAPIRQLFREHRHGGIPAGAAEDVYVGHAGSVAAGAEIRLAARLDEGTGEERAKTLLASLRFEAFGCPYLIAAAESLCRQYEGQPVSALADFEPAALIESLSLPVAKIGRILLLEDALRNLVIDLSDPTINTQSTS